jgi:hypothetical protein
MGPGKVGVALAWGYSDAPTWHAAQTDGLESNVRVTERDPPAVVSQMAEPFQIGSRWNSIVGICPYFSRIRAEKHPRADSNR